jgi:hypothetical protein
VVPIDDLVIVKRSDEKGDEPSLILSLQGDERSCKLSGGNLLASFRCGDRYLFVCDMDCVFEESLEFHLVSASLEVLDSVSLGLAYTTGEFRLLEAVSYDRFQFSFFNDEKWELYVRKKKALRFPFSLGPFFSPISRRFSIFNHLSLREVRKSSKA